MFPAVSQVVLVAPAALRRLARGCSVSHGLWALVAAHSQLTDVFKIRILAIITTACLFVCIVDVALLVVLCDTSFLTFRVT